MLAEKLNSSYCTIYTILTDIWVKNRYVHVFSTSVKCTTSQDQRVNEFLMKKQICVIDHPPYSPDLSPCDYFLFPKLKTAMKGAYYDDVPIIQATATQVLKNIPKTEFKKSRDKLVDRFKRCIELNGSYFE